MFCAVNYKLYGEFAKNDSDLQLQPPPLRAGLISSPILPFKWGGSGRGSPLSEMKVELWKDDLLPRFSEIPTREIVRLTGFSKRYVNYLKNRKRQNPHGQVIEKLRVRFMNMRGKFTSASALILCMILFLLQARKSWVILAGNKYGQHFDLLVLSIYFRSQ